ncbi:hypothetical protein AHAS_Ahas17G0269900 [Arachis hypogaea]
MESRKRKHILEDSSSESKSESTDETQSKKRKHVIEDSSSEEENHSYDGMPEVSLATETDPLFQGQTEQSSVNKPSDSMFSREEESLSDPAQQQIIVFRPSSQPLDIDPTPEATAAALLMMVRTVSYVPKELPLPSFSLGLTDSSQEETQTQEGVGQAEDQVVKNPETTVLIEELDVLVEKIAKSGEKKTLDFSEGKTPPTEKTYADDSTHEYDSLCTLNAQQPLVLSRVHFASLKVISYIEADIVTAMCLILNQENIKRFQEEIYCLPPNIVNMAIGNHPNGEFLQPKSKKPFNVEDYPMFIPFLDRKKLASHPYKKFYILDPYHKTCPSRDRMKLNKFIGYVISRIKVYAGGTSQEKRSYDCVIYVMKWLKIIEPQNVKKGKYE